MKHTNYKHFGLKIDKITIKFKGKEDDEYAKVFFHGEPIAYYLLKYNKYGAPSGCGWKPLSIEMCINDNDDYDVGYSYTAKNTGEFDRITTAIRSWMKDVEKKENSVTDILELKGMPYLELFRRCF